jgi:hypothetical protein
LITGYVCRRCGALNLLDAEFEYASYRDGDKIVAEITGIHPGPARQSEIVSQAADTVRGLLREGRVTVSDATAALERA